MSAELCDLAGGWVGGPAIDPCTVPAACVSLFVCVCACAYGCGCAMMASLVELSHVLFCDDTESAN